MALGSQPCYGQNDPVVVEAKPTVETCTRYGIPTGIHTNLLEVALKMTAQSFHLVNITSDDRFLTTKA